MPEDNFSISEQKIIETAKTLFWKHGIKRVSVEEICSEAGVSKMTFYRKFKNKGDLVFALLQNLYVDAFAAYEAIMAEPTPFPEKIKKMVLLKHESAQDISQEFMLEVYKSSDERIAALVLEASQKSEANLRNALTKAQTEGWIRPEIKIDAVFYLLHIIQEKIFDPAFLAMHANTHDAIMEMTNFFFYGIISTDKK